MNKEVFIKNSAQNHSFEYLFYSSGSLLNDYYTSEVSTTIDFFWGPFLKGPETQWFLLNLLNEYTLEDLVPPRDEFDPVERNHMTNALVLWIYMWANNLFSSSYPLDKQDYQFLIFFRWLYDEQLGSATEFLLSHYLHNNSILSNSLKNIFKSSFMAFQNLEPYIFSANRQIGYHTTGMRGLVFKTSNLLKITRLIMGAYHSKLWNSLSNKSRFKLLKAVVAKTRELGNYSLINELFNTINFIEGEAGSFMLGDEPNAYKLALSNTGLVNEPISDLSKAVSSVAKVATKEIKKAVQPKLLISSQKLKRLWKLVQMGGLVLVALPSLQNSKLDFGY